METLDRARRLIKAATGDENGDGYIVTNMGIGFSEPGYDGEEWVTGNWNPRRFPRDGEPPLTNEESLPSRLADALEKLGVETLWLDEWEPCHECYKAVRTVENSYSWLPSYINVEGTFLCMNCATFDDVEDEAVNNHNYAVPRQFDLSAEGFTRYNDLYYESGWHPGQNDNPEVLKAQAQDEGWEDVVFQLDSTGQFDMRFSMWVRSNPQLEVEG